MNKIGVIGGTGLYDMPDLEVPRKKSVVTPYGEPSSPLVCGTLAGLDVVFLARHGERHTLPPHRVNYRANIAALRAEGVTHVVAVNAVGGIRPDLQAGTIVLPHQIIDYTYGRENTFWDNPDVEMQHIDFTQPYDEALRQVLHDSLNEQDAAFVCSGVHGVMQGPRLETAAEIDRLERDGCDIVGMTGMPEAALAREGGMAYACLALVVNLAAGRNREVIGMEQIRAVLDDGMPKVQAVVAAVCRRGAV